MRFLESLKSSLTTFCALFNLSPFHEDSSRQKPIGNIVHDGTFVSEGSATRVRPMDGFPTDPPIFHPPGGLKDAEFVCDYSKMPGWEFCSIPENRECWLRNKDGREFNIHTDYEKLAPVGITRYYDLNVTDGWINADGQNFTSAKLFNATYPGPYIQACWGDTVNIRVRNYMKHNGTSIHWHGIRQNRTMHMDGVNGVTQCPIAPGDYFNYTFKATQYGSSWYHSHFSVQYADGLQGPLTIHGPVSAPFDEPKRPLLMTDWSHHSSFRAVYNFRDPSNNKTILLNGHGNVTNYGYNATLDVPQNYELHFEAKDISKPSRAKRYLLRLINTSFDSTFVFSIDNHWLQVVSADFVPIEPYYNTSVLVGIGQRYHVIVEANPDAGNANPLPPDGNFWIRTWVADRCGIAPGGPGYEKTGILRYNDTSDANPVSLPWTGISKRCSDETYSSLRPKIPWYVGPAANGKEPGHHGQRFNVTFNGGQFPSDFLLAKFSLQPGHAAGFTPLQINYSDPIFLHLNNTSGVWPKNWVVVPQDYKDDDWVYLVLTMDKTSDFTLAHPIHLHGHDFAILQQEENKAYEPSLLSLNLHNPPRRDVVLLPNGGFVAIAFKADNPGNWLMHCHIARHASEGLALQINERQSDSNKIWPFETSPAIREARRVCKNWDRWSGNCKNWWPGRNATTGEYEMCDCKNWWPGKNATGGYPACDNVPPSGKYHIFQDDSGI